MLNDILTLDQLEWFPNRKDFSPISWPGYRDWSSPNYKWFPWCICNGCDMPAGNAYTSGHLVPSFYGFAYAPIAETSFPHFAVAFYDFLPQASLGTFSILLLSSVYNFQAILYVRTEFLKSPRAYKASIQEGNNHSTNFPSLMSIPLLRLPMVFLFHNLNGMEGYRRLWRKATM